MQQKKIPTISPSATATEITDRYSKEPANCLFRVSVRDLDQITLLAACAVRASKTGKIGLITDTTGYGQLSPPFRRIAGAELAGRMIFSASITEDSTPQSRALYDAIVQKDGTLPTYVFAAHAYDAVKLLAAAMEQAQSVEGEKIQQALEDLRPAVS